MDAPTPLHLRIQASLRGALANGTFPPGRPLPGENALARRFGAARMTVRRALAALEGEGLIRREPGRGTWPAAPLHAPSIGGLLSDMRHFVGTSRVRVLDHAMEPATTPVATAFGIPRETACRRVVRVRFDALGPFSHVTTWLPPDIAPDLDPAQLGDGAVLDALAERGHVMAGARQLIAATAADPATAEALGITAGSPLTMLDRVAFDAARRPLEFSRWLYRPDRFAYAVSLGVDAADTPPRWVGRTADLSILSSNPPSGRA